MNIIATCSRQPWNKGKLAGQTSPRCRTLYSNILCGIELSLPLYNDVEKALESRSPHLMVHKFGMRSPVFPGRISCCWVNRF
ncbi:hypothetical protein [Pseudomonas sp. Q2-TVG4-2]|uniref:hypothetical protein n=1 Tax=Pseudomonas sp. Q2-TVG4-2 TaxID=1685699 RepID=UPI0015E659F4|nr:hypothetical protein [Pseudomonas sp. Q2-TVG4-2]